MQLANDLNPIESGLAERLEGSDRLPSLPVVAIELLRFSRDCDGDADGLVEIVGRDPASAARLIRRANSAYYGRRAEVETLKDAVVFLGLNDALSVALAITLVPELRRDPLQGLDYEHFWRRSLVSAAAGRLVGTVMLRGRGELLFLAALLQDIGMLLVQRVFPGTYVMDLDEQRDHHKIREIEQRKLWADHAAIGAWLLSRWGMPGRIVRAVAASHEPTELSVYHDDPRFYDAAAATGLLADLWLKPGQQEVLNADVDRLAGLLDCDVRQLFELANGLADSVAEVAALFEIDVADALIDNGLLSQLDHRAR